MMFEMLPCAVEEQNVLAFEPDRVFGERLIARRVAL